MDGTTRPEPRGNTVFLRSNTPVIHSSKTDLPEGAILMPKSDVVKTQLNMIKQWSPKSEVWALTFGSGLLGGVAAVTGIVINSIMRRQMRLFARGRTLSYVCTAPVPAGICILTNSMLCQQPMLLHEIRCPACLESRAVGLQAAFGFVQPMILSLMACSALAKTAHSVYIPGWSQPVQLLNTYRGFLRPYNTTISGLLLLNLMAAGLVTYFQQKQSVLVEEKMTLGDFQQTK